MFNFKSAALISALFLFTNLSAQTTQQFILWSRIQFQILPGRGWQVMLEAEDRRFPKTWTHQQSMARLGLRKTVWKGLDVYAGFSTFQNGANFPDRPATKYITELRPELGLGYQHVHGTLTIYHRLRGEFRIQQENIKEKLAENYLFFGRLRYQINASVLLNTGKKNGCRIWMKYNAEPMVNVGSIIKGNPLDQMRVYAGFEFEIVKGLLSLEPGYLFIYQKRLNQEEYFLRHIVRTTLFVKFNTEKKK